MLSPILDLVQKKLEDLLEDRRIVVFYDPQGVFGPLFDGFDAQGLLAVDARASMLEARRNADTSLSRLLDPENGTVTRMLIYVPWERGRTEAARTEEPFEAYALMGATFGDKPEHALDALARQAMPERVTEIDRLFSAQGTPSVSQLEALAQKAGYPLLAEALGTEDPLEIAALLLLDPARPRKVLRKTGVLDELLRMLSEVFGFDAPEDPSMLCDALGRFILFSEFAFDLGGAVPAHTAGVARAAVPHRKAVYALCDRMREAIPLREAYMVLASEVERALGLSGLAAEAQVFGERDTFAAEDTAALAFVSAQSMSGRLGEARKALDLRKTSIWREVHERSQRWQLAHHALGVLEEAAKMRAHAIGAGRPVSEHVHHYVAEQDGLYRLDRAHRWMERAAGDCLERESVDKLLEHARRVYREVAEAAQVSFFEAVKRDGWPPEGPKQTQAFARHVAPALKEGERVAYFLVDALRYEMGRDLSRTLERLGTVRVEHAATVVPTTTPFGMAALMPGAEAGIACAIVDGALVPTVSGKCTATVDDRRERLRELLGDRVVDVRLDDLLDWSDAQVRERIGRASLVVVRSDDIDRAGEGTSGPSARRFMSGILDDLGRVAQRLSRAGISRMVFAADHGHVLVSEVPPGDVVKSPPGNWVLEKRRCRVGAAAGRSDGVWVAPAAHVGLFGPVAEVALATGFRVFTGGSTYFHEGLSLQECVVPVLSLEVRAEAASAAIGPDRVEVLSKQPRFNSRVFMIRLKLVSLLHAEAQVRVMAVDAATGRKVGRVGGCDAQDPATGLITVTVGNEVAVPIQIDEDFGGSEVLIQVLHGSGTGVELGKKKLKNECSF
ncbi:PglZ domain-containing protein [Polyangium sp. 15x6]|uniref:PglZ domain-containing protein n=1 Tax=Polyangium sp. 15x6 TaxID=3042687 RepID=UPI00249BDA83|nr:PglZ domain-containing protein [Polyangium sp. 15x6]MDI3291595.1 PglZ domain-containing protein [Polyangium sp. 15x6]